MSARPGISERLLVWHREAGRHDLPWQRRPTPYRVWVSEIMLQQTQVSTVIPFYERFMHSFPTVQALAAAHVDRVLHHWSGLGYYARARNLHAAAGLVVARHGGRFPVRLAEVEALPGVGRSTAGAILALACGQRHPILDGNVKRVLARYHAVAGWPGRADVLKRLWSLAEVHTPREQVAAYTQAIMDLGATICRRGRPACADCPLAADCRARQAGRQDVLPAPRPKKALPVRSVTLLLACNGSGAVLLERRPPAGIWGGLWSFPELDDGADARAQCRAATGLAIEVLEAWPVLRHSFTHFRLDITPLLAVVRGETGRVMEGRDRVWYNTRQSGELGLAAPVRQLLLRLAAWQEQRGTHDENRALCETRQGSRRAGTATVSR